MELGAEDVFSLVLRTSDNNRFTAGWPAERVVDLYIDEEVG